MPATLVVRRTDCFWFRPGSTCGGVQAMRELQRAIVDLAQLHGEQIEDVILLNEPRFFRALLRQVRFSSADISGIQIEQGPDLH